MYVKTLKESGRIRTIYSNDFRVAAFDPALYGEVNPQFQYVDGDNIIDIPDDQILLSAKTIAIEKLSQKRIDKLNQLIYPATPSPLVQESYRINITCAENILAGNGDGYLITYPVPVTYREYMSGKAEAKGFATIEDFCRNVVGELGFATYYGGQIEEKYYKLSKDVMDITVKTTIDDALDEINTIVDGWK